MVVRISCEIVEIYIFKGVGEHPIIMTHFVQEYQYLSSILYHKIHLFNFLMKIYVIL